MNTLFKMFFCSSSVIGLVAGVVTSLTPSAWAISESTYPEEMASKVMPFYNQGVQGSFTGKDGVPIHTIKFENPNEIGAVVVIQGKAEAMAIYAEVFYDLAQKGYSVYSYDHRGQGASGRLLPDSQKEHINDFDDYVTDMKTFVDTVVNAKPHSKRYVLAHSMGGAIATLYGIANPGDFDAYAMSSPMFKINTAPYPLLVAEAIIAWQNLIGNGEDYGAGQKGYNPALPFAGNDLTSCELRWNNRQTILNAHPELQVGGATNRWVQQAFKATKNALDQAASFQPRVLIFEAADDTVVHVDGEEDFCANAPHCTKVGPYEGARHELLREKDAVRDDVMEKVFSFFLEN